MKVLYVCGDTSLVGGIEKYNNDFISALRLANCEVKTVQRKAGGLFAKLFLVIHFFLSYLSFRPNVIFCGHLNFSSLCYTVKKIFRTPYTLSLYGIEIISLRSQLKKNAVENADRIVTISEYSKELIFEKFPHKHKQIFMLPSAVDGEKYNIKPANLKIIERFNLQNKLVILSLARLSTPEFKGQDRVLKALPEVLKTIPNAVYIIAGGGRDERVEKILQQQPELSKNVVFTGLVADSEKADLYNLADVYVLPSKFEGFGIVFIESLACGTAVIASDGYGCRAGLLNGTLGQLVQPDDISAIAQSVILALQNSAPNVLKSREELRTKTLEIYGIDRWNLRVKNLIQELQLG